MQRSLIINSPFTEPKNHWIFSAEEGEGTANHNQVTGRRKAGYTIFDPKKVVHNNTGVFYELTLVNNIRVRVDKWRREGYPQVTGITKALLEHWNSDSQTKRLFFCQIEAIETLIWLLEGSEESKIGITIPSDGGLFERLCCKLATGAGKTTVMAMLITWHTLNSITYPGDKRFKHNFLIIAPNLIIKERLQVLKFTSSTNQYDEFNLVPHHLNEKLRNAKIVIHNWHSLVWQDDEKIAKKKGVDKRGAKSDKAYAYEILGDMANEQNIIVINDEAHHAWRLQEIQITKLATKPTKDEREMATKWISGLDRIHSCLGISKCYDFSATPSSPIANSVEEGLFQWIVSDFGLTDAIESGIVKTPRISIRDNANPDYLTKKSKFYHIYSDAEVKDDLNRKNLEGNEPLPDLIRAAFQFLGSDWKMTWDHWNEEPDSVPPVFITIANTTDTAKRIKHSFDYEKIPIPELCNKERILHIDSDVFKSLEGNESDDPASETKAGQIKLLRDKVNTVGKKGEPGELIQNVISVNMLTEGWDARTVTHILGLRAFTSQLLCEQIIGRGLRRSSYDVNEDGLFEPEYVTVFGIPFSFLPMETGESSGIAPNSTEIKPDDSKANHKIEWPNVSRIDTVLRHTLQVDWDKVLPLKLKVADIPSVVAMAPTVENNPDYSQISELDLEKLVERKRLDTFVFNVISEMLPLIRTSAPKEISKPSLLGQLVKLCKEYVRSDKINVLPITFNDNLKKRNIIISLHMNKVVQSFISAIVFNNSEKHDLIFNRDKPIRSTSDSPHWKTSKPVEYTKKSHISHCVADSNWELTVGFRLDLHPLVESWVKNDHLNFEIEYIFNGIVKKYWPDYIIKMVPSSKSGDANGHGHGLGSGIGSGIGSGHGHGSGLGHGPGSGLGSGLGSGHEHGHGVYLILELKGNPQGIDSTEEQMIIVKQQYAEQWASAVTEDGKFGKWSFRQITEVDQLEDILEELNSSI